MTRTFFLAACVASALASCVAGTMPQEQQSQYGQEMGAQQMSDQNGQQMGAQQMSDAKGNEMADQQAQQAQQMAQSQYQSKSKDSGSGNTVININNPVIIIAMNAGGSSQTQMLASTVQPPQTTHTVTVGGADAAGKPQLMYSPDSVMAAKYDMVQFNFMAKNHTLTQSTFPAPCMKMQPAAAPAAGMPAMPAPIDSNFMPFDGKGTPPMMMVQVIDTMTPMWFYCKQKMPKSHCGAGMTFSINPSMPGQGAKTQAAFKAAAMMQAGGMMVSSSNSTAAGMMGAAMASGAAAAAPPAQAASTGVAAAAASQPPAVAGGSSGGQSASTGQMGAASSQMTNGSSMAQGTGQSATGGACECSCLCGANSFPNAMQGIGMMGGGFPGSIPAPAAGMKFKA